MKGFLRAGVLVAVLGVGVSQAQQAQQQPRQKQQQQQREQVLVPLEWSRCLKALEEPEPVARLTGTVQEASGDALIIEDTFGRRVDLHGGDSLCLLWAGEPVALAELQEGTTVQVSYYVDEEDGVTARVVRVIEQQKPAP
ncbi:MAG TPA: hypothetical protein VLQ93_05635 [Myxococcaceae bacterium]|nr:hypothetical protein [Myxococcaceae bacterium]